MNNILYFKLKLNKDFFEYNKFVNKYLNFLNLIDSNILKKHYFTHSTNIKDTFYLNSDLFSDFKKSGFIVTIKPIKEESSFLLYERRLNIDASYNDQDISIFLINVVNELIKIENRFFKKSIDFQKNSLILE